MDVTWDDTLDRFGRPMPPAWIERNREMLRKNHARHAVSRAVKSGKLVRPSECPRCSKSETRIEAHHRDYAKPLEVEWLCAKCHRDEHKRIA